MGIEDDLLSYLGLSISTMSDYDSQDNDEEFDEWLIRLTLQNKHIQFYKL